MITTPMHFGDARKSETTKALSASFGARGWGLVTGNGFGLMLGKYALGVHLIIPIETPHVVAVTSFK